MKMGLNLKKENFENDGNKLSTVNENGNGFEIYFDYELNVFRTVVVVDGEREFMDVEFETVYGFNSIDEAISYINEVGNVYINDLKRA